MKKLKFMNDEIIELYIKNQDGFYKVEMHHVGNEGENKYVINLYTNFDETKENLPIIFTLLRDIVLANLSKF